MKDSEVREFQPEDVAIEGMAMNVSAWGLTYTRDGKILAYGGFAIALDGKRWGFMHIADEDMRRPMHMHRLAIFVLKMMKSGLGAEPVFVVCERARHPMAEKWLRRLGFAPTDERVAGNEVWTL